MRKKSNNNLLYVILVLIALEAILFYVGDFKMNQAITLENYRLEKAQKVLSTVSVDAKAVSVYDATTNDILYGKNDETPLPLASLTKIITIVTVLNAHSPDDIVSISKDALSQDGDYGLFANEKWKVGDLAKLTLIVSANDGAYALSQSVPDFLQKINEKAKVIGMQNASFLNPTGLDIDSGKPDVHSGASASADDVNTIAVFAYKDYPGIFDVTTLPQIKLKSESGFEHTFKNTDTILDDIPNLLFSKTGFTNVAGGNLCIIFKNKAGHEIAITLLGSTFDGRFVDMKKLVDAVDSL